MEKRKDPKDNEHISSERCLIYVLKNQLVEPGSGDFESFQVDTCSLDAASTSIPATLHGYFIEAAAMTYARNFCDGS